MGAGNADCSVLKYFFNCSCNYIFCDYINKCVHIKQCFDKTRKSKVFKKSILLSTCLACTQIPHAVYAMEEKTGKPAILAQVCGAPIVPENLEECASGCACGRPTFLNDPTAPAGSFRSPAWYENWITQYETVCRSANAKMRAAEPRTSAIVLDEVMRRLDDRIEHSEDSEYVLKACSAYWKPNYLNIKLIDIAKHINIMVGRHMQVHQGIAIDHRDQNEAIKHLEIGLEGVECFVNMFAPFVDDLATEEGERLARNDYLLLSSLLQAARLSNARLASSLVGRYHQVKDYIKREVAAKTAINVYELWIELAELHKKHNIAGALQANINTTLYEAKSDLLRVYANMYNFQS